MSSVALSARLGVRFTTALTALLLAVAAIATGLVTTPAQADYSPIPRVTTWSPTNGRVYAIERIGDTVFIGGSFTTLRRPPGQAGTTTVTRNRLAAFNATTGALLDWNPGANGEVRALQGSGDGETLFVGGSFTAVDGTARNRIAALGVSTGTTVPGFNASASNTVFTLERVGNRLFVGGTFTNLNGPGRNRIGAVDTTTGAIVPGWTGGANSRVTVITASPDGQRIYVGGRFRQLSGQSRDFIGALNTSNGSAAAWRPPIPCADVANPCYVFDVAADPGRVYVAMGGPGGRVSAFDTATAERRWNAGGDGDVQAVDVQDGVVYAGGHFEDGFGGVRPRAGIAAVSATGGGTLNFRPFITEGLGVWEIDADTNVLRIGGGFRFIDGATRLRYAEFPVIPGTGDDTPPSRPADLRATDVSDTIASLAWDPSSDLNGISFYELRRNDQQVATPSVPSYTDRDLSPSTSYTYEVRAVDPAGNASAWSDPLVVQTDPLSRSLVKVGSLWRYLSNGSDQGTDWRNTGFNDSAQNGWSTDYAQLGFGDGDESTAISPLGVTHYFRQRFTVDDPSEISALTVRLLRDDGAVVYINGQEVWRSNMPGGAISYQTQAATEVTGNAEDVFHTQGIDPDVLVPGTNANVIAVEVHNRGFAPHDVSFDLELVPTYTP